MDAANTSFAMDGAMNGAVGAIFALLFFVVLWLVSRSLKRSAADPSATPELKRLAASLHRGEVQPEAPAAPDEPGKTEGKP